jgi:hypothetical protein
MSGYCILLTFPPLHGIRKAILESKSRGEADTLMQYCDIGHESFRFVRRQRTLTKAGQIGTSEQLCYLLD